MSYQNVLISGALKEFAMKLSNNKDESTSQTDKSFRRKSVLNQLLKPEEAKKLPEDKHTQKTHYSEAKIKT